MLETTKIILNSKSNLNIYIKLYTTKLSRQNFSNPTFWHHPGSWERTWVPLYRFKIHHLKRFFNPILHNIHEQYYYSRKVYLQNYSLKPSWYLNVLNVWAQTKKYASGEYKNKCVYTKIYILIRHSSQRLFFQPIM